MRKDVKIPGSSTLLVIAALKCYKAQIQAEKEEFFDIEAPHGFKEMYQSSIDIFEERINNLAKLINDIDKKSKITDGEYLKLLAPDMYK